MQCTALFWCQLLGHYPAKYRVMVPAIPGPYLGLAGQCRHGFPPRTCLLRRGAVGAPGVPAARQRNATPLICPSCRKATRGAVISSRPSIKRYSWETTCSRPDSRIWFHIFFKNFIGIWKSLFIIKYYFASPFPIFPSPNHLRMLITASLPGHQLEDLVWQKS